jgi:hypothetical protein
MGKEKDPMSTKSVLRRLQRAFSAKDERAFDDAMEELEEKEEAHDEGEPDTVEIHNHIPGEDALGEMPPKDPKMPGARDDEMPEWFKKHQQDCMDRFKSLDDNISALQKWAKEEGEEPEHQDDEGDPNLEMDRHSDDRSDDRRSDDRRDRHMDDKRSDDRRSDDRRGKDAKDDEPNKAILGELEFEAPPGTGDKARKARDSAYLEDSFQDTISKAEILAPGLRVPTFDCAADPRRSFRAIDSLRRTALDLAYNQPETRGLIDAALSGRALDTKSMGYGAVRVLFNSVASMAAANNNSRAVDRTISSAGHTVQGKTLNTLADINRRNAERYGRKSA